MERALGFSLVVLVALSLQASVALCEEDSSFEAFQRKERVREVCERNPNLAKCEKFLDSEYRRYSDIDRDTKETHVLEESRTQESHEKSVQKELMTYCREVPDAPRCSKLKSRPSLSHSFRTVKR